MRRWRASFSLRAAEPRMLDCISFAAFSFACTSSTEPGTALFAFDLDGPELTPKKQAHELPAQRRERSVIA